MLDAEIASGTPSKRIVLGGFSQGGAMTYYAGLTYPKPLAGLVVLSGFLPLQTDFPAAVHPANRSTPIFVAHGP
jgi:phospholipase/carboxylesterase